MDIPPAVLAIIERTIDAEGGERVTDDPADRGGLTKFGITQATWTAFCELPCSASVAGATREQARKIYAERYWMAPGFNRIHEIDAELAVVMFDWGVTSGPATAVRALQRALNALNSNGADYPDITADGVLGRMTINALQAFKRRRSKEGLDNLRELMRSLRRVFYLELSERDRTQERFAYGWLARV